MDTPLYDIYLTGKLADDVTPALAAQRLASLFKSTPEAMAGLITGKAQLLKRGVDKNTAIKYRDALQNAGCEIAFKAQASNVVSAKPATTPPPSPTAATAQSTPPAPVSTTSSGLQLAPVCEDLLKPEEHHVAAAVVVETAHLSLAPVSPLPVTPHAPAVIPDISHLSLAATGGNLVDESELAILPAIAPDTSDLSLAEVGAPLETLKPEVVLLHPDTSGLQLAPLGSEVLTPEQRLHVQPTPPNTDHIKLAP